MIEIQLENKEIIREELSRKIVSTYGSLLDFNLARNLLSYITDEDLHKDVRNYIQSEEKGKETRMPVEVSELSKIDFSKDLSIKAKRDYAEAEEAKSLAVAGQFLNAITSVENIEVRQESMLLKAHSLALIAEIVDRTGIDATPVFVLGLDQVRDYLNHEDTDSLDALEGVEMVGAILAKASELQYFNIIRISAERTLENLNNQKMINQDVLVMVAAFCVLSGGLEKVQGMDEGKIKKISQGEINELLALNNDLLNQALTYFGRR